MTNPYENAKALYHTGQLQALKAGQFPAPIHVQLIISDLCNQNCNFCAYRMPTGFSVENFAEIKEDGTRVVNPNRMIPKEKCFEILEDCRTVGVKAIQFTGGGEPTVHPDHVDIFRKAQNLGLETALVTNGAILRDFSTYNAMTWIRVSLDAGTEETYAKTRESKSWKTVLRNLEAMTKLDASVTVGVGFVVTKYNYKEIELACRLVKDIGLNYVRLSAVFSSDEEDYYTSEIFAAITDSIKASKQLETNKFKVISLFGDRIRDLGQGKPDYDVCGYQNFTTYIGGDQKVYRCCTTSYTKHGEIGDLRDTSFLDWFRNRTESAYRGFNPRTCHHCQFNNQNRIINKAISKPMHENFV